MLCQGFKKYNVSMSDREILFYKSIKSGRWWMEMDNKNQLDNKTKSSTLLSCTHQDYLDACNDIQALNNFQRKGKDSFALPLHSITKSLPLPAVYSAFRIRYKSDVMNITEGLTCGMHALRP